MAIPTNDPRRAICRDLWAEGNLTLKAIGKALKISTTTVRDWNKAIPRTRNYPLGRKRSASAARRYQQEDYYPD